MTMVVALTGGIASGKTTAADLFLDLGVPIIDADEIARDIVRPGQSAHARILAEFGPDYFFEDGELNRQKLRQHIFTCPESKASLEHIMHPEIHLQIRKQVECVQSPYCLVVIPLLAESKSYDWVDRVLVVDVEEKTQLERVMKRDQIGKVQALAIIQSQAAREERLKIATDVISNTSDLTDLKTQVERLHKKYMELVNSTAKD